MQCGEANSYLLRERSSEIEGDGGTLNFPRDGAEA